MDNFILYLASPEKFYISYICKIKCGVSLKSVFCQGLFIKLCINVYNVYSIVYDILNYINIFGNDLCVGHRKF